MITQPQENIDVPNALKQKQDAVRNQISIGESEVKRLSGLMNSKEYTIGELHKEEVSLNETLNKLNVLKDTSEIELKSITENINAKNIEFSELLEKTLEESKKLDEKKEVLDSKEKEVDEKTTDLVKYEKEVDERAIIVSEKETKIEEKALKLKEVLRSL